MTSLARGPSKNEGTSGASISRSLSPDYDAKELIRSYADRAGEEAVLRAYFAEGESKEDRARFWVECYKHIDEGWISSKTDQDQVISCNIVRKKYGEQAVEQALCRAYFSRCAGDVSNTRYWLNCYLYLTRS